MGRIPRQLEVERRHRDPDHVEPRPSDPRTNTRPRGNGPRERQEMERGVRKLELVLGH